VVDVFDTDVMERYLALALSAKKRLTLERKANRPRYMCYTMKLM
jgi:hypothetical protein